MLQALLARENHTRFTLSGSANRTGSSRARPMLLGNLLTKKVVALAALIFAPVSTFAAPAFETGGTLLDACNAPNLSQHWYCLGYVAAIADLHIEREQICLPPGATKDDLTRVVKKYLEVNPVTSGESASDGVLYALMEAFPCP